MKMAKKKKQNKIDISDFFNIFLIVILVGSVGISMIGLFNFMVGFHNLDTCHNEETLALQFDIEIYEVRVNGQPWSLQECYLSGLGAIINYYFVTMLGILLFGLTIGIMLTSCDFSQSNKKNNGEMKKNGTRT